MPYHIQCKNKLLVTKHVFSIDSRKQVKQTPQKNSKVYKPMYCEAP